MRYRVNATRSSSWSPAWTLPTAFLKIASLLPEEVTKKQIEVLDRSDELQKKGKGCIPFPFLDAKTRYGDQNLTCLFVPLLQSHPPLLLLRLLRSLLSLLLALAWLFLPPLRLHQSLRPLLLALLALLVRLALLGPVALAAAPLVEEPESAGSPQ